MRGFRDIKKFLLVVVPFAFLSACSPGNNETAIEMESTESDGIIGGNYVTKADVIARSTVALVDLRGPAVICSGSLVARDIILTAAHCMESPQTLAILFSTQVPTNLKQWRSAPLRKLINFKIHAAYTDLSPTQMQNHGDIALIQFQGALPQGYAPAALVTETTVLKKGQLVTLAGYGMIERQSELSTDALRKVNVLLADPVFSEMEVILDQTQGRGACHGDSGGPAFVKVNNRQLLMGVTSRGHLDPMDTCKRYAVYSNVRAFLSWINASITQLRQGGQ
jgi:secreted trypsin-like serine protease